MNEQDLRDCFAMFAMIGASWNKGMQSENAEWCYAVADAMLEARKPQETIGLPAIKKRVRK